MYLELQEGKTRMMRLRFADGYPATVATTLRMVAAIGLGGKILPAGEKLRRVVIGDSYGSRHAQQLARCKKNSVSNSRAASKQHMPVSPSSQCARSCRV
jgi:hypothetical protein